MKTHTRSALLATSATGLALALALSLSARPAPAADGALQAAAIVERGADHVDARTLAERLARGDELVLIDVRETADYATFHLPGAVRLDLVDLLGLPGETLFAAHPRATFVLYSNGMTHPAQAWMELARRGQQNVYVLEDGLEAWVRDVTMPPSLRGELTQEAVAALEQAPPPAPKSARDESTPSAQIPPAQKPAADKPAAEKPTAGDATALKTPAIHPAPKPRWSTDPATLETPTFVSTEWLARHAAHVVVIDAREKPEAFAAGHVPGALHVPTNALRETRDGVPDQLLLPEALAKKIGALGIAADTRVVAYGDEKLQDPSHFALALLALGHQRVAVLEGGFTAWKSEQRPLSQETVTPTPRVYEPTANLPLLLADLAAVRAATESGSAKILDVRPADAFRGDVTTEARAGHIPGSINRPYTLDVESGATGLFGRSPDDLRREYAALGLTPKTPLVVTCRTGHQASQTYFLLRFGLGYESVRWYDGSWKEWAAHPELPVELGPGPAPTK